MKKIHTQDLLSGEKFKFLSISKHSSLVKLCVVWLNVKSYQTDCPVKNINFRVDWKRPSLLVLYHLIDEACGSMRPVFSPNVKMKGTTCR